MVNVLCLPFASFVAVYVHGSKLSKSFVTLLSVNCPPFASEVIF